MPVPDELGDPQRAAGIARRRLDPEALERTLAQDPAVPHAVERDPTREAELLHAGEPVRRARHAQHRHLADFLNRTRDVEVALDQVGLRHPRWRAEQLVERPVGHGETAEVVEVLLVQAERAVFTDVDHVVEQQLDVFRLTVGGETHDLVLARVHLEAEVVGERGVQETQRIRPVELAQQPDVVALAHADRGRGPLAHAVHGEDRGPVEGRRKERARRVRLVMLGVEDLALVAQLPPQLLVEVELVLDPERPRHEERSKPLRRDAEVGLQDPLELEQGLVVKADEGQVADADAPGAKAVLH